MLILEFDNVEDGLHLNDDTINDIEIIQDNQIIHLKSKESLLK